MAVEGTVQLGPDSTSNKNLFRVVEVVSLQTLKEYIATGFAPMQEVVALADGAGNLIGAIDGGALRIADEEQRELSQAICKRLDLLILQFDSDYTPDDGFGI